MIGTRLRGIGRERRGNVKTPEYPEEAKRIAALPPQDQLVEMGKLAAGLAKGNPASGAVPSPLSTPSNRAATSAPINPIRRTPEAPQPSLYELGSRSGEEAMEAYAARRMAELRPAAATAVGTAGSRGINGRLCGSAHRRTAGCTEVRMIDATVFEEFPKTVEHPTLGTLVVN